MGARGVIYKILEFLIKVSSSYHLCIECFSQLSFDSEVYMVVFAINGPTFFLDIYFHKPWKTQNIKIRLTI